MFPARPPAGPVESPGEDEPSWWAALDRAFDHALEPVLHGASPAVVLFSGGVDSGLLAWELRGQPGVSLFTVGTERSSDLDQAAASAASLGLPWTGRRLTDDELDSLATSWIPRLEDLPLPRRGIFLALSAAIVHAPTGVLVLGQGADELFLGYAHYRGLSPSDALRRSAEDLEVLRSADWPRTLAIARLVGRELAAPFLQTEFDRAAEAIPIADRLPRTLGKEALRRWAAHRGLPEAVGRQPKRAIQYGSGIDRWLRKRERRSR